jgi:2-haloacid dehalogenase
MNTTKILGANLPSRRDILTGGAALALAGQAKSADQHRPTAQGARPDLSKIKALTFDVQGSSTDFWGTIVRNGQAINRRKGLTLDWGEFADAWRALYRPAIDAILNGQEHWRSVDSIYRDALDTLIKQRGITSFSETELVELNAVWHRLEPWPDTIPGLQRLKRRYILATLSNADMSAMVRVAKHSDLPWDVIMTAELAKTFKPDPKVYHVAAGYLGLQPDEIMMVACHKYDLRGAKAAGLQTAFVARPLEFGPGGGSDVEFAPDFTLNVTSFLDLADRLGT